MDGGDGRRSVRFADAVAIAGVILGSSYLAVITVDTMVGVIGDGDRPLAGTTLEVEAQVPPEQLVLSDGYRRDNWIDVTATIEEPSAGVLLSSWTVEAARASLLVAVLALLHRIVASVRTGIPFERRNVARLRTIGWVLLVGFPVVELLAFSVRSASLNWFPSTNLGDVGAAGPELPVAALLAGVGVHVLAVVFAEGLQLREDVEATI